MPPVADVLASQRTHVLFVLGEGETPPPAPAADHPILRTRRYALSEVDVTRGHHVALPFRSLSIHELSVDGAEEAAPVIERLVADAQGRVGTWLSFPLGEQVGTAAWDAPYVTLAFANGYPGQEPEFREWYPTRHIRHAMAIPALTSGQCHLRTGYQHDTVAPLDFEIIALYEQTGTPEDFVTQIESIERGTFAFPAMDVTTGRFAESAWRRLA
jgi:hypothetical protein